MWTHVSREAKDIDRQVFPRLIAVAEVAWLKSEKQNFYDFTKRLKNHYSQLDRMGIGYWLPSPH